MRIVALYVLAAFGWLSGTEALAQQFGQEVSRENAMDIAVLQQKMSGKVELDNIKVIGKVTEVCQKKGCWMKLENPKGEPIHVMFKDYALFMPKDLAGKTVVLHGKSYVSETSVSELRHYAQDAGASKSDLKKIQQSKKELKIEADGVQILTD
ncbi:MAG TPA: DUF4920 domain-containing protein [Luteibaculaceae bacterium]|nr:DUF4920 domain-containing protein [Luteibaculaceae bacterium]